LPGQRIGELNALIEKQAAVQQAYDAAVAKGDDLFNKDLFEEAHAAFTEAQKIKPGESYPTEMLAKTAAGLTQLLEAEAERKRLAAEAEAAEQARLLILAAEKANLYTQAITRADSLFNLKDYEDARSAYQLALQTDGEANYPKQRISEVDKIIEDLEVARLEQVKIETEYRDAVARADKQFDAGEYLQAKAGYEVAMGLKPGDTYPEDRIAEIDRLLKQLELDEKYNSP
jgi:tetratricopeptide (TPR) repeat protein